MPPHKSEDYKISAVQYLSKNKSQLQTCEVFQCHPRSLMRWVDKYNKNKNIRPNYLCRGNLSDVLDDTSKSKFTRSEMGKPC